MARFCTNCGTSIEDTAAFCPKCGKASAGVASSAAGGAAVAPAAASSSGLADNVAGMLAYITIIPAIIFLVVAPYNTNKFVRFHSFQSIFFGVLCFIIDVAFRMILPWVLWPLWSLIGIGLFVVWIILLLKAYKGEKFKLPVIGDLADQQA